MGHTEHERGQTTIDYSIGISIFLVVLSFTLLFVPSLISPFTESTQDQKVISNKVADTVSKSLLVESVSTPFVLDSECTEEFFDGDGSVASCTFDVAVDGDQWDLNDAVGVREGVFVQVTIEDSSGVVTHNGVDLEAGPDPGGITGVTIAKRIVRLDGDTYTLFVRVW